MKQLKLWRLAFVMLAAFSLVSCSSDDDDKISKEEQQRWLTEMSDNYEGLLNVSVGDEERTTIEGFSVSSNDVLALSIPLEEIAKQIKDEAIATRVREIGYAEVTATYKFIQTDEGAAHFMLYPSMVANQQITQPLTRTSPVTYQGLTLLFSQNYGGTYFYDMLYYGKEKGEKTHAGMTFNICVDNVLIDGERIEGFKPVKFSFMGGVKSESVLEEASLTSLTADAPQADKAYLGSGYDVTGAYLSNSSLRENVIDLSKCKDNRLQKWTLYTGTGKMPGDADNAKGFLKGLCESLDFKNVGEPGDVYFAGTFTDNPLFKDASERGNGYSFLMYMDCYSVYIHRFVGLYPSDAELERVLTDEFKKALTEESAEHIVERFGTHVLMNARLGLNILSLYRSGLEANTSDAGRFTASMFRRMGEVYNPIFWNKTSSKATKGGAISVQFHGGSTQQLSAALGHFPLSVEESSAAVANWWNESCESQTNLSLTLLQGDDLWPIYKLIPDEEKRAEVERAVKAYIHSHQLK